MAHLGNAFECDICKTGLKSYDGWFIGGSWMSLISILPWEVRAALIPSVAHLCGIECAQKWVGQRLQEVKV